MNNVTAWKCEVCGYVHEGDSPPETCPVCGVGPEMFTQLELAATPAPDAAAPPASAWRCTICGHVHQGGAPPEICPVCAVGPELFEPLEAEGAATTAGGAEGEPVVIVGAGIAAVTAAQRCRATAPGAKITLVSKEPGDPYYRLNLSRFLAGEVEEPALRLQPEGWFAEQRIELVHGEVTAIDRQAKAVTLRDGATLPYARLILASGAHAFVPPIPGVTREGVLTFRTLEDTRAIITRAARGTRCACIGGGLLGLETAGALARRGVEVTVLEGADWLLPRQLTRPAAQLLRRHIERLGIAVRCGVQVQALTGDEAVHGVQLAGSEGADGGAGGAGDAIPAELVVLSTGVRPNSYLARQCGLQVKGGVVVDDGMITSDPAILAAGDVAEHRGVLYGIWPAAYAQGVVAGINAGGGGATFPGMPPANSLKVLEVDLLSVGTIQAEDASYQVLEEQDEAAGTYRRLVCRDGKLVGAILYGDTALGGQLKEAIEDGLQLLQQPALLAAVPGLAALLGRRH